MLVSGLFNRSFRAVCGSIPEAAGALNLPQTPPPEAPRDCRPKVYAHRSERNRF